MVGLWRCEAEWLNEVIGRFVAGIGCREIANVVVEWDRRGLFGFERQLR